MARAQEPGQEISIPFHSDLSLDRRRFRGLRRQVRGGDLRDVEELRRGLRHGAEGVAEHGLTEGTGGAGRDELFDALDVYALAFLFAEKHLAAAGAAAETALAGAARLHDVGGALDDLAGLVVFIAIAAEGA